MSAHDEAVEIVARRIDSRYPDFKGADFGGFGQDPEDERETSRRITRRIANGIIAALEAANLLATNEEWAVKVPWPKAPEFLYRGFSSEQAARDSVYAREVVVSRRITEWKEVEG